MSRPTISSPWHAIFTSAALLAMATGCVLLTGCYSNTYDEGYACVEGDKKVDGYWVSARIFDASGQGGPLIHHRTGPYRFFFSWRGDAGFHDELLIHAVTVRAMDGDDAFVIKPDDESPDHVIFGWNGANNTGNWIAKYSPPDTFRPAFEDRKRLEGVVELSIKTLDGVSRHSLRFTFEAFRAKNSRLVSPRELFYVT